MIAKAKFGRVLVFVLQCPHGHYAVKEWGPGCHRLAAARPVEV